MSLLTRLTVLSAVTLGLVPLMAQQTFWGTASQGGTLNQGTLYTVTNTGTFTKRFDFQRNLGNASRSEMIKATNGLYYGVARQGGVNGVGVLFSYNPSTGAYNVLVNFISQTGALSGSAPEGGVIQHSNGKLYGLCRFGGAAATNHGTFWEYNIATSTFTKLVTFTGNSTGIQPVGRPVEAPNGKIYFATNQGGASNVGSLCEWNPTTSVFTRFFVFTGANGSSPTRGLTRASNGLLYGTTSAGGTNSLGVLYQLDPTTNAVTKLADFSSGVGSAPVGELCQAADGHLYGTCSAGGTNANGTIFRYQIAPSSLTKVFDMASATGRLPYGRLMQASNGLLYGMTYQGGTSDQGVLYSFNTATSAYAVVLNLAAQTISLPFGGFLEDGPGNLIATTSAGGVNNAGVLFRYDLNSSQYTQLVGFDVSTGASPWNAPVRAADGKFYGVTVSGGVNNSGVIYSFDPTTSAYVKLVDLGLASGRYPYGKPLLLNNKLYGTCNQHPAGFPGVDGTIWAYDIGSQTFSVLLSLTTATGTRPLSGMIVGNDGKLYGNTSEGGTFGYGTFFSYEIPSNTLTVIKHHRPQDGTEPYGEPFQASNGIIYGPMNASGVTGTGAIYQYNPVSGIYAKILDMPGTPNGAEPAGQMAQAANGKLYGLAGSQGGSTGGVIYEYTIGSPTPYAVAFSMTSAQGQGSESGLLLGNDGLLYGSNLGGGSGNGTLIRYNIGTNTFTVLRTLASADGILPYDGLSTDAIPPSANIAVNAKASLEGPYTSATGLMNDALRSLGTFPLTEPFTAAGFTLVGAGGETINASVLSVSGNNAIVDWILLELRDKNNSSSVLRSKCALIQRDGDIVDLDGTSPASFTMPADQYFIAVRHRNHLGIMTSTAVALSGTPVTVDLRDAGTSTFGTNARTSITGAVPTLAMWAGNVVPDAILRYSGGGNDRDPILVRIGGAVPTNTVTGYWPEDVNMDGVVRYSGGANDRDIILVNIGGAVPTNSRAQQLP
ncbi:MAG: hypothetical protein JNM31_13530 [Flavobacteriales bacterium]|nr:hypothetical protein [Flavobacteriales bacterium]